MKATIDFESEQPSTPSSKFEIRVNDGHGETKTFDSDGSSIEVTIERLPVRIEVREQYSG